LLKLKHCDHWFSPAVFYNCQKDFLKMTLKTCAITSMNDNGYSCLIGQGLGIDLHNGTVFLANVEEKVSGPAMQLRSVRL
jgi:hypothetical protein